MRTASHDMKTRQRRYEKDNYKPISLMNINVKTGKKMKTKFNPTAYKKSYSSWSSDLFQLCKAGSTLKKNQLI